MRRIFPGLSAALLCVALPGLPAAALDVTAPTSAAAAATPGAEFRVTDAAGLAAAVVAATGGETILLAPGNYGKLAITARSGQNVTHATPVTIRSADPAKPAVLTGLDVQGATGFAFENLTFDYVWQDGDRLTTDRFRVLDSTNIAIRGCIFDGDIARSGDPAGIGYATGRGFRSANNVNFDFIGNTLFNFWKGIAIGGSDNVRFVGNDIHSMRSDGLNVSAPKGLLIESNHFHDFIRAPDAGDHADMIQFASTGATRPATDVTIRGNLLRAGDGGHTQSIFMRNDIVDKGLAGSEMFWRNVTIEDNVILNGHLHGITLGETDGVVIRGNTLLRDPALVRRGLRTAKTDVPRIRVNAASVNVVVTDNIAYRFPENTPGWNVTGNLPAQDISPSLPDHYDVLFMERPAGSATGLAALTPLMVRPAGPADRPGLGSSLMR